MDILTLAVGFFSGLVVGFFLGVVLLAILAMGSKADDRIEKELE